MSIVLDYPWWFVSFAVLVAMAYSGILYYRNKANSEMPQWLLNTLAAFRFIVVFLLCFLLLSPLINTITRQVEKPIVVFALDNSSSITTGKDSTFYKTKFKENLKKLTEDLADKYDVRLFSFANKVKSVESFDELHFNEKQTALSDVFEDMQIRYSNNNLGAIILASDGLYNRGSNPLYTSDKLKVPVYSIAMGDTTVKKDIVLQRVEHNRIAFLGNSFPLQIVVSAKKLKGQSTILTVIRGKEEIFSQKVSVLSNAYTASIPVFIPAKERGLQHYKVSLSSVGGEATIVNNTKDIFIEVIDSRQKILILYNTPHPDVAAIKRSIDANENYEVEQFSVDEFNKSLDGYNMVIMHGLPKSGKIIESIKKANLSYWLISGANVLVNSDFLILSSTTKNNECEPVIEKSFPLFTLSDEFKKGLKSFSAVMCPYSNQTSENVGDVLFYQQIGSVETQIPLMVFHANNEIKSALFYGEGLWRWRIQEFAKNENTLVFDEFISKTVQYLAVKEDKSFFRISGASTFTENDNILFYAELYNDSYELINEPEINVIIKNTEGKKYNFAFSKTSNAYRLDAGLMPVGEYTLEAKVNVGTKLYTQRTKFHVIPLNIEILNSTADHGLLYSLAQKNGGQMVYPNELEVIKQKLNAREDITSVVYSQNTTSDLINNKWLFGILLLLITTEWFIRKRNGLN
jgi:hypothetical protein